VSVIDVRTPVEYLGGHIHGAVNIDINGEGFEEKIKKLDAGKKYIVNCLSGGRSARACNIMTDLGGKDIMNLVGGMSSWRSEGLPVER
jgi:rhodanese-related sulfurtransferase